jgi:6-phosphogluconate dehydrogenase
MQLGMIGLGRMGGNIVRRLLLAGHAAVVYDRSPEAVEKLASEGATPSDGLENFVAALTVPRVAWVMLPAGAPTDDTVMRLAKLMSPGDIIIDGGNSYYKDDIRRAKALDPLGIHYVDVGTSGGVWGLERGYCMMIGGKVETVMRLDPIFGPSLPGAARSLPPRDAKGATRGPRRATSMPGRAAPAISSRWCTTASNTA